MPTTFEDVQALIKRHGVTMIDFKEIDLDGRWHHLSIPVERFRPELMVRGVGFDGSSYGFLTVEKSDMVFIPDLDSAFVDPVSPVPTISMIGDIYGFDGGLVRFDQDPRYVAEKAESFLADTGISDHCMFGPEFEFYILDNVEYRTETNHIEVHLDSAQAIWNSIDSRYDAAGHNLGYKVGTHGGYHADLPFDSGYALRTLIVRTLEDHGIPVKYHHSENGGPGQAEVEIEFATLKEVADRTQKVKYVIRNLAARHGKTVTFMPKPFHKEAGSGLHVHMHMFLGGEPIFYDEKGYSGLSRTALFAMGGILRHAAALAAIACPSTNSYKRLVPGFEAPVAVCFGAANRSSVIRIPAYARAPRDKCFEFRASDATANPYLLYSALTMAMIDGVQRKLDPVELGFGPYDKNMYRLTDEEKRSVSQLRRSLEEAADALERDHGFLLNGAVFSERLIANHLVRIRRDAAEVAQIPHPVEFAKYYDL